MVGYLAIVYALFTDLFIFGETLGTVELLGCAFVVSITLIMGFYRMKQAKKKAEIKQENIESINDSFNNNERRLLPKDEETTIGAINLEVSSNYLSQYNEFANHSYVSTKNAIQTRKNHLI